jgi:hypothetical protein
MHFRKTPAFALSCLLLVATASLNKLHATEAASLHAPAAPNGWSLAEEPRIFTTEDVFEMVDGGADFYLEYGLVRVLAAAYKLDANDSIQVEIWELKDSAAAFGVYSVMKPDKGETFICGREGRLANYYLSFWKGRHYLTVTGSRASGPVREAIRVLARNIDAALPDEGGPLPALLGDLPQKDQLDRRYVRGAIALQNVRGFDAVQAFHPREAALGEYPSQHVALLRFADAPEAAKAFAEAVQSLKAQCDKPGLAEGRVPQGPKFFFQLHADRIEVRQEKL